MTRNGMVVLGSWGAANLVVGAIGMGSSTGETKYFHQMNFFWGAVNLAIAGSSFLGTQKKKAAGDLPGIFKGQVNIEKTFLFNAGLDLVYLSAGAYCIAKSKSAADPRKYMGYGKSLYLQGGGLLIFDVIMYLTHLGHGKQLYRLLDKVQFSGNSAGIVWPIGR